MGKLTKNNTIHLVYGREYQDSDERYDEFFYSYSTIFRNVPMQHIETLDKFKDKIKKYCDENYNESATNFVGNSKVKILHGDDYYTTYEDAFGETARGDNSLFNDYGQLYNGRQFFKKDYEPKITEQYSFKNLNRKAS
tara:strand:+ start:647 stop:1060 length:414 start_codon:yes stop_codon:yes gene_type:complete